MRRGDWISVRVDPGAQAVAAVAPLVLGLGSRAGLTIEQLDELVMATELVLDMRAASTVDVRIESRPGQVQVVVRGADPVRAEKRRPLLAELVTVIDIGSQEILLRAGL